MKQDSENKDPSAEEGEEKEIKLRTKTITSTAKGTISHSTTTMEQANISQQGESEEEEEEEEEEQSDNDQATKDQKSPQGSLSLLIQTLEETTKALAPGIVVAGLAPLAYPDKDLVQNIRGAGLNINLFLMPIGLILFCSHKMIQKLPKTSPVKKSATLFLGAIRETLELGIAVPTVIIYLFLSEFFGVCAYWSGHDNIPNEIYFPNSATLFLLGLSSSLLMMLRPMQSHYPEKKLSGYQKLLRNNKQLVGVADKKYIRFLVGIAETIARGTTGHATVSNLRAIFTTLRGSMPRNVRFGFDSVSLTSNLFIAGGITILDHNLQDNHSHISNFTKSAITGYRYLPIVVFSISFGLSIFNQYEEEDFINSDFFIGLATSLFVSHAAPALYFLVLTTLRGILSETQYQCVVDYVENVWQTISDCGNSSERSNKTSLLANNSQILYLSAKNSSDVTQKDSDAHSEGSTHSGEEPSIQQNNPMRNFSATIQTAD